MGTADLSRIQAEEAEHPANAVRALVVLVYTGILWTLLDRHVADPMTWWTAAYFGVAVGGGVLLLLWGEPRQSPYWLGRFLRCGTNHENGT